MLDPRLQQTLLRLPPDQEMELCADLDLDHPVPEEARIVCRFGDVATLRMRVSELDRFAGHPAFRMIIGAAPIWMSRIELSDEPAIADLVAPPARAFTGSGTVVAAVDWGIDFAAPTFRTPEGRTRLRAIWDQRDSDGARPNRYGYGRIISREDIDAALATSAPYRALRYDPADSDAAGRGSHGTHVLDIAGSIAPKAELVFVHLSASDTMGLKDLGDSVRLLEALDFVFQTAGDDPCSVNLSVGRMAGGHNGLSSVERAIDSLLESSPGRAIAQSCGNYFRTGTHASGRLRPLETRELTWRTKQLDTTPNELEIWLPRRDRICVELEHERLNEPIVVVPGEVTTISIDGRDVGLAFHQRISSLEDAARINVFLRPDAPAGKWIVRMRGLDINDGRFHAWIERDGSLSTTQSTFDRADVSVRSTLGTIANGFRSIVVGAYDPWRANRPIAPFSSSGPTRDGRQKPDLLAPGVRIRGARSTPAGADAGTGGTAIMSGTSMASPHVAGTIALAFEASRPRRLPIATTRALVIGMAEAAPHLDPHRAGAGYLDIDRTLHAAAELGRRSSVRQTREEIVESVVSTASTNVSQQERQTVIQTMRTTANGHVGELSGARIHIPASAWSRAREAGVTSLTEVIQRTDPRIFVLLAQMSVALELTDVYVNGIWRPPSQAPSAHPSGRGLDLGGVETGRRERVAFNNDDYRIAQEPALAARVRDWLWTSRAALQVTQVIGPWWYRTSVAGTWQRNEGKTNLERNHRHHLHVTIV